MRLVLPAAGVLVVLASVVGISMWRSTGNRSGLRVERDEVDRSAPAPAPREVRLTGRAAPGARPAAQEPVGAPSASTEEDTSPAEPGATPSTWSDATRWDLREIGTMVAHLRTSNNTLRGRALQRLETLLQRYQEDDEVYAWLRDATLPYVLALLDEAVLPVNWAEVFRAYRAEDLVGPLALRLRAPTVELRRRALLAMGQLGEGAEAVVPHLLRATADEDTRVRAGALRALACLGRPEGEPPAAAGLFDVSADVRLGALSWFQCNADRTGDHADGLRALMNDADERVRSDARLVVKSFDSDAALAATITDASHPEVEIRRGALLGLPSADLGASALPLLRRALHDPDAKVRAFAAMQAGKLGSAARPLFGRLQDLVRDGGFPAYEATLALPSIDPEAAVETLRWALRNGDEITRTGAALAAGRLGALVESLIPDLAPALAEETGTLYGILEQMEKQGETAHRTAVLVAVLNRGHEPGVSAAAMHLQRFGRESLPALPALERAAARSDSARVRQTLEYLQGLSTR